MPWNDFRKSHDSIERGELDELDELDEQVVISILENTTTQGTIKAQ